MGVPIAAWIVYKSAEVDTVGELSFQNRLRIPPLLEPSEAGEGRRSFELHLQQGVTELLPGKEAETWGANGAHLGPTLRASRGDLVQMSVENELPETTTLHWHGMHLPAAADGGPHQTIAPGSTWSPSWRIDQPAATLWYHPHMMGETADHVYRDIAGLFILEDARTDGLLLPRRYGVDDIPLIVQDKRLEDDGSLDFSQSFISPTGRLGSTILVNGTYDPYVEVRDRLVRFRLLNASNARVYDVGFDDDRLFHQIGTDAGLLERPHRTRRVQLSPGERAEIVARFEPGERVVVRSSEPDLGTNFFEGRFSGEDDSFDLLQVRAADRLRPSPPLPRRLTAVPRLHEPNGARTRHFELTGSNSINGQRMDMERIDEVVLPGATEIWEVENASGAPHNFHPHGVSFRVLEYEGASPSPSLSGPKDTVYVRPNTSMRLLVDFPRYSDHDSPYMFHCHVLQHEDRGMMGQFVVADGEAEGAHAEHGH